MRSSGIIGLFILSPLLLTGCLNLKPAEDKTRYFVLAAPFTIDPLPDLPVNEIGIGVGPVTVPSYYKNTLAVRTHTNELSYLENYQWSERLDRGIQRVVAFNLSRLLQTDTVVANSWQRDTVQFELQMSFMYIETAMDGRVLVEVFWQLFEPGGEKPIHTEVSKFEDQGDSPMTHPEGTVYLFSKGLGVVSREIALKIKELAVAKQ
jgi:uncharacterized lipoprotein YmbA